METEILDRVNVPILDEILGKKFKVLDDGFIRLIDYMGDDGAIVQAARVSYGKGTKKLSQDASLIKYLMRHQHLTPFEMCELKLHVRVPMDHWRQWIRHRAANVNEYSTRYSEAIDSCQTTKVWRAQAENNKQGSSGLVDEKTGKLLSVREKHFHKQAREVYKQRLDYGVAREQARKDLPLSTYTEAYWKIDLRNLLHFLALRCDSHAQEEIRKYAEVILYEIVKPWVPLVYYAFQEYHPMRGGMTLTRPETHIIMGLNSKNTSVISAKQQAMAIAENAGWLKKTKSGELKKNRERDECEEKLGYLGLEVPWK